MTVKLKWPQVHAIREAYIHGRGTQKYLAKVYGITAGAIGDIVRNETWHDPDYIPPDRPPLQRGRNTVSYDLLPPVERPVVPSGTPQPGSHAKLSQDDAKAIRERYDAGDVLRRELAQQYGVSTATIGEVLRNMRWHDPDYIPPTPETRRAARKNRTPTRPNARLDWDTVRAIRQRYNEHHVPLMKLAEDYGVRVGTISFIVDNVTWYDPEYTPPQRTPGRGRTPGESHPHARLTWEDVREIRQRATEPYATQGRLGEEYGVSAVMIGRIIRNQSWVDPHYTPPKR